MRLVDLHSNVVIMQLGSFKSDVQSLCWERLPVPLASRDTPHGSHLPGELSWLASALQYEA